MLVTIVQTKATKSSSTHICVHMHSHAQAYGIIASQSRCFAKCIVAAVGSWATKLW